MRVSSSLDSARAFAEENWGAIGGGGVGGLIWGTFINFGPGAAVLMVALSAVALGVGWYVSVTILTIRGIELNDADGRQLRPSGGAFIEGKWASIGGVVGLIVGVSTAVGVTVVSALAIILTVSAPVWVVNALLFVSLAVGFGIGRHVCERFWAAWGVTDEQ